MRDLQEIIVQNPEQYNSIFNFIKFEVIPKYPCLTYVHQANFDEEGNPRVQYYIRYAAELSVKEEDSLFLNIFHDITGFCKTQGISYGEDLDVDFILTVDDDFHVKQIR